MEVVTAEMIRNKQVLLRLDIDVPIVDGKVADDFRLVAGMSTLELCLEHANKVIICGHVGRPNGQKVKELSVTPIYHWLVEHGFEGELNSGRLQLLENLRFDKGEEEADVYCAKELAAFGDYFVNEAFAAYHRATSTTVLPMLLPHSAGLHFAKEVTTLTQVRQAPRHPLVAIIGGVKVEDKLPAVLALAKIADHVLVGGKIVSEMARGPVGIPENVLVADLTEEGKDITAETVEKWIPIISSAQMILWNGPMGYIEDPKNNQTERIAQLIVESLAESIVGGGDTVSYLDYLGDLPMFSFVSTGGGAMLEYLVKGTLPSIEALN